MRRELDGLRSLMVWHIAATFFRAADYNNCTISKVILTKEL